MENATLLTYLAATLMEHTTTPTSSSQLRPTLPLPTARPHSSPIVTARTPRIFHPMHSTGYNSQRQNTKRSGDYGGGSHRGGSSRTGIQNNGGLDRPVTGAIVIGSIFLFITMSITAAIVVFCKKKNTVFIFGAGNKYDGDLYTDTSINMAPEDLLDENSEDEEDSDGEEDGDPSRDSHCARGRLRENEAVALDPRLLRDPRGLELIALTTGRRDLQALYRDLFCSSVAYQQPAPDDANLTANQTPEFLSRDVNQPMNGDQLDMLQKQQRRLPAYRVSATSKYQRMLCSALVEQRQAETANGPPSAPTGNVESWLPLDSLGRERVAAQQMDPQRLGASAIAATVREDVIRNRSVIGSVKPCTHSVDLTDPSFIMNPHFSNTDPPDQETHLGSSPSHRPWRQQSEEPLTVLPQDLTSLHVTLVANSGRRLVRVNPTNERPVPGFSPEFTDCGVGKEEEEEEEEELVETEDNALLERGHDLSEDEDVGEEEEHEEEEEEDDLDCEKDSQLLNCTPNTVNSEGGKEDQPEVNQPLLTE